VKRKLLKRYEPLEQEIDFNTIINDSFDYLRVFHNRVILGYCSIGLGFFLTTLAFGGW
jgi:hypothetical protein